MAWNRNKGNAAFDVFKGNSSSNWRLDRKDKDTSHRQKIQDSGPSRYQFNRFSRDISSRSRRITTNVNDLKDLLQKDATAVLFTIIGPQYNNFKNALSGEKMDNDLMTYILVILGKAISAEEVKNVASLTSTVASNSSFSVHVQKYLLLLQKLIKNDDPVTELQRLSIKNLLEFLLKHQLLHPASACDLTLVLLPFLIPICDKLFEKEESHSEVKELLNDLECNNDSFIKQFTLKEQKSMIKSEVEQTREPPNNFREISVLPTPEEIIIGLPFFRPNITHGKYLDADHYLDVHYRLLREDFMRPLREGINCIRAMHKQKAAIDVKLLRNENIWFYDNFRISRLDVKNGVAAYITHFDLNSSLKNIEWENSKHLKEGSLICFSENYFETMHFATIVGSDPKDRAHGELAIMLETNQDCFKSDTNYIMIENQAYFEAYRHTLGALQELYEWNMPLKDYVINAEKSVKSPVYLTESTKYELNLPSQEISSFPVLNYQMWPSASAVGLDESQYAALRSGLTKEFSIIQGPPGTGKTFIGLKIVEILLQNRLVHQSNTPILVMCYTNHALDQFLEGILKHTDRIVRIGGRSKSVHISEYQLNEVRNKYKQLMRIYQRFKSKNELSELEFSEDELSEDDFFGNDLFGDDFFEDRRIVYKRSERRIFKSLLSELQLSQYQLNASSNRYKDNNSLLPSLYEECGIVVDQIKILAAEIKQSSLFTMKDEILSKIITMKHFRSLLCDFDNKEFPSLKYNGRFLNVWLNINELVSIEVQLLTATPMSREQANAVENVWALLMEKRWSLYKYWTEQYLITRRQELKTKWQELKDVYEKREEVRNNIDLEILRTRLVVGMTTTGAAKHRAILKKLNPQIVIFEEAAEVLEAHIVTCLTASVEHVILIGDHQQLKPNTTVYELSKKFNFDVSLFERMVKNGVECHSLNTQHRMRPAIASLLVPHVYSNLKNHEYVFKYENVRGISSNLFFVNHNYSEDADQNLKSHVNKHECQFLMELCRYLLRQDYKPSQITILTTYLGQLFALKKLMNDTFFSGIRIAVVDNFQGEENDIVLISFVRSNEEEKIGFLSISNRVCVALSRAKIGLYAIGNFDVLSKKSALWKEVVQKLKSQNNFGDALRLCCHNHPETFNDVSTSTDFAKIPNGVCPLICNKLLDCGHMCPKFCHVIDSDHRELCEIAVTRQLPLCGHEIQIPCHENINKRICPYLCSADLPCGHKCQFNCSVPCPETCQQLVAASTTCNHSYTVECFINMDPIKVREQCKADCETVYDCGHKCPHSCGKPCSDKCEVKIKVLSTCGHDVTVKCSSSQDPEAVRKQCQWGCQKTLPCGHACPLKCGEICIENCEVLVTVLAECGHPVMVECSSTYFPKAILKQCTARCEKSLTCGHACPLRCNETCSRKCNYKIPKTLRCGHDVIAPCSIESECKAPCEETLQCGHRCQNLCGQECMCERTVPTLASCGHEVLMKCNFKLDPESLQKRCRRPCEKTLECGHRCRLRCMQDCKCKVRVSVLSSCGHDVTIDCDLSSDLETVQKQCVHPCEKILECGHSCKISCRQACKCTKTVLVPSPCGHNVQTKCFLSADSLAVQKLCKVKCEETLECGHKCLSLCGACTEHSKLQQDTSSRNSFSLLSKVKCQQIQSILSTCGHEIKAECYKITEVNEIRKLCLSNCEAMLECGHKCIGKCGRCFLRHYLSKHESCREVCGKVLKCGHRCPSTCGNCKCMNTIGCKVFGHVRKCEEIVLIKFDCGHETDEICGNAENIKCLKDCERILECGHRCKSVCNVNCECSESVAVKKRCGHWIMSKCSERDDNYCRICKASVPKFMLTSFSSSSSSSSCDGFSD